MRISESYLLYCRYASITVVVQLFAVENKSIFVPTLMKLIHREWCDVARES